MSGGIDWFRWHHGSVTDPKFQLVAERSGASLPCVLSVWAYLLEKASAADFRGCFGEIDCESVDFLFGFDEGKTDAILTQMEKRKLICDEYIVAWDKRQPKRERSDDYSTDRVRAFRQKKRHETPCNANDNQETPREEKRREEIKDKYSPSAHLISLGVSEQVASDFIALRKAKKAQLTETAINGIKREADKAGWSMDSAISRCCERGWQAFKADWVKDEKPATPKESGDVTLPNGQVVNRATYEMMRRFA